MPININELTTRQKTALVKHNIGVDILEKLPSVGDLSRFIKHLNNSIWYKENRNYVLTKRSSPEVLKKRREGVRKSPEQRKRANPHHPPADNGLVYNYTTEKRGRPREYDREKLNNSEKILLNINEVVKELKTSELVNDLINKFKPLEIVKC